MDLWGGRTCRRSGKTERFCLSGVTGRVVKLVVPTDFDILDVMSDGKRQTAPNLAEILDHESKYMNNRLSELAGKGLVEKVGPSKRSGMYVITEEGRAALALQDEYSHDRTQEFDELVEEKVAEDG